MVLVKLIMEDPTVNCEMQNSNKNTVPLSISVMLNSFNRFTIQQIIYNHVGDTV